MRNVVVGTAVMSLLVLAGCRNQASVGTEAKSLTLVAPSNVIIVRGQTAEITVKLERHNFPDPVKVKFENLPKGVKLIEAGGVNVEVGPVHVDVGHEPPAIGGDKAIYTLKAEDDAPLVGDSTVSLLAEGPDHKSVTTTFNVTVKGK